MLRPFLERLSRRDQNRLVGIVGLKGDIVKVRPTESFAIVGGYHDRSSD